MSLWTPDGEHHVPRNPPPKPTPEPTSGHPDQTAEADLGDLADIPGFDELSPEEQAQARAMAAELAEARRRLADTPAAEIVANHAMGCYELAAIHLSAAEPDLEEARLAIDAMAGICNALPGRLGQNEQVLREALQQLQIVYVQVHNALAEAQD